MWSTITCEGAASDADQASTASGSDGCITVDADGTSGPSSCLEICDVDSAGGVLGKIRGGDAQHVEASSIDGTPSLTQGRVRCSA